MPTADGRFKGMSVPAHAWERIFGAKPGENAAVDLRQAYEEHLNVLGPDSHSPFLRDFRR